MCALVTYYCVTIVQNFPIFETNLQNCFFNDIDNTKIRHYQLVSHWPKYIGMKSIQINKRVENEVHTNKQESRKIMLLSVALNPTFE